MLIILPPPKQYFYNRRIDIENQIDEKLTGRIEQEISVKTWANN